MNNDEKETDSSSSSSVKEGSGGGYSADCSGSDQSLDGDNDNNSSEKDNDQQVDSKPGQKPLSKDVSAQRKKRHQGSEGQAVMNQEGYDAMSLDGVSMGTLQLPPGLDTAAATTQSMSLPYAQWNGIAISNPMDHRIDFSTLAMATANYASFQKQQQEAQKIMAQPPSQPPGNSQQPTNEVSAVSLESYARLLEAVRPFFFPQGPILQKAPAEQASHDNNNNNNSAEQTATSSEGFTSFFTTTDSNTGDSKSPESSEEDKKMNKPTKDEDALSLEVQARPKRRHQDYERRVQIQVDNDRIPPQQPPPPPETAIVTDARTSSSGTPQESANERSSSGNATKTEEGSEETPTDQAANDDSAEPSKPAELLQHDHHHHQTDEEQHRKRQDKKRKRIEMRREYEAQQQQFESSESSDGHKDKFLRPGKPLRLDEAMIFSNIPRILVQSHAPFLVVHTNAAFSRMTGIDSHFVVGRPISRLLTWSKESSKSETNVHSKHRQAYTTQMQSGNNKEVSLDDFFLSCGYGVLQTMKINTAVEQIVGKSPTRSSPSETNPVDEMRKEPNEDHDGNHLICRIAVAPILSAANAVAISHYPPTKARRMNHDMAEAGAATRIPDGQIISHYVIHLEPKDNPLVFQQGGADSISSNSSQTLKGVIDQLPSGRGSSVSSESSGVTTGLVAAVG